MMRPTLSACCLVVCVSVTFAYPSEELNEMSSWDPLMGNTPWTNPPPTNMKERFKAFLRKIFYGITSTTIYTTLIPMKFPEEYDPIKMLEWQLAEEKRKGITTPDWEPRITKSTNLWDGYFNDPTFDDKINEIFPAVSNRTKKPVRYWEPGWKGHRASDEAIARLWLKQAEKENAEWHATYKTTKYVPIEDITYDSEGKVKFALHYGDGNPNSDALKLVDEAERADYEEKIRKEGTPEGGTKPWTTWDWKTWYTKATYTYRTSRPESIEWERREEEIYRQRAKEFDEEKARKQKDYDEYVLIKFGRTKSTTLSSKERTTNKLFKL